MIRAATHARIHGLVSLDLCFLRRLMIQRLQDGPKLRVSQADHMTADKEMAFTNAT